MSRSTGKRSMLRTAFCGLLAAAGSGAPVQDEARRAVGIELFESAVRPVLVEHCVRCHGARRQRGGLRLDSPGALRAGGERGPVVVPGEPDASRLVRALRYDDEELQMPPDGRLDSAQIERIERWVGLGAPVPEGVEAGLGEVGDDGGAEEAPDEPAFDLEARRAHWAFQPLGDPAPPAVRDEDWPADPLDRFVLARLEAAGLAPAPDAERRVLARRLSFDLRGLPPTPEEVAAFEADAAPGALERLVDRWLDSAAFAERWARHWLDLVRYAESKGHEFDHTIPNAWQYRDWVIRAIEADVPFDRFVVEQVAGDLVAEPRRHPTEGFDESVLGTGWWFLGEEVHSPVDVRADQCDRIANRVDVLGKAVLGLTVACARCHDHKFDPITARDYAALAGFDVSTAYRQVRFDTDRHNAGVAAELAAARAEHEPAVRAALAETLAAELAGVARYVAAAERLSSPEARPEPTAADVPADLDVLLEDFERTTWGGWSATGSAFGEGPVAAAELPGYQGDVGAIGARLVNSHAPWIDGVVRASDEHTGVLESPPFVLSRDWVHLLVGGGDHAGETCVQLVVDGAVAGEVRGASANRMTPRSLDARGLRGRVGRLRVVDRHTGGWGNVGLDHVVLSDDPDPEAALSIRANPDDRWLARWRVERVAAPEGLAPARLAAWAEVVAAARAVPVPGSESDPLAAGGALVRLDLATAPAEAWRTNGHGFGTGPLAAGALLPGDDPARPLAGVLPVAAAAWDRAWDVLELAPEVEGEPGAVSWVQAGRTLRTPTFRLETGRLAYLVRGRGRAYAAVAGHRLVAGPLHGAVVRELEAGDGWRWVEHDLAEYAGRRAHVELTPREGAALHLARVVELRAGEGPTDASPPLAAVLARAEDAAEVEARLVAAVRSWAADGADVDPDAARLIDALVRRPELLARGAVHPRVVAAAAPWLAARAAAAERIARVSRLAPAAWDGNGVDEPLLSRGNPRAPLDEVPRRLLEVLAGPEPLVPDAAGSGRLALAEALVDPSSPLPARVLANRVWHHLTGRGLVASVDDLGHMGEAPTHPALLDRLARDLVADGWSLKRLVRRVVLSRTYRQASVAAPAVAERAAEDDPANRLRWRARVRRLEAEAVRDTILAVCGSLDRTRFGPPVPVHLTPFLDGRGRPAESGPLDGGGRRSVYLAVRRNFLPPFFTVFDFPPPATTMGRRSVSNVPAQALALQNDPFVVEQARRWAERALASGLDDAGRVAELFATAFARAPEAAELEAVLAFLEVQRVAHAEVDGADEPAEREARAWADLCHVLLNAKELVYVP